MVHSVISLSFQDQYFLIVFYLSGALEALADDAQDVTLEHVLTCPDQTENMDVTGLSWNSTGAVVAAWFAHFVTSQHL